MYMGDMLDDGQAKAGSAKFPGARLVHAVEPLENPVQVTGLTLDPPCGDRRSCGDHQDFEPPGLAHPRSTTRPGPAQSVLANSLLSPRIPVQFRSRHSPFAQFPHSYATMERQADPILEQWAGQTLLTG